MWLDLYSKGLNKSESGKNTDIALLPVLAKLFDRSLLITITLGYSHIILANIAFLPASQESL